jgi:hypothetical protein
MTAFIGPVEEDEQEWSLDWFSAEIDRVQANPPAAPEGLELVECTAEPRHWPTYVAHVEGMYPAPCYSCIIDDYARSERRERCKREHRRWKSWRIWTRLASRLYTLGITSSGGGVSFGRCEFCGIGRQAMAPHWRGKRPYILGAHRETWACLLKRRHRRTPHEGCGLCTKCAPCPECGSTHLDGIDCAASS